MDEEHGWAWLGWICIAGFAASGIITYLLVPAMDAIGMSLKNLPVVATIAFMFGGGMLMYAAIAMWRKAREPLPSIIVMLLAGMITIFFALFIPAIVSSLVGAPFASILTP
jgi:RsiW-degrading membrane proteinase PrsW (M82 family)